MNCGYNFSGCQMPTYLPTYCMTPFNMNNCGGFNGFGGGTGWFAIVLVVFLLLFICGCTKIC